MRHRLPLISLLPVLGLSYASEAQFNDAWFATGDTVEIAYLFPDASTVYAPSPTNPAQVTVGSSIELTQWPISDRLIDVDFSDGQVTFDSTYNGGYAGDPNNFFNGYRIADATDSLDPLTGVSIVSSNLAGFDASRISFNDDNVYFNFAGLATTTSTQLTFAFSTAFNSPTITTSQTIDGGTYAPTSNNVIIAGPNNPLFTLTNSATTSGIHTFDIGNSAGDGRLRINAGSSLTQTGFTLLGRTAGSTGSATVSGPNSTWTSGDNIHIGHIGQGSLRIEVGGVVTNTEAFMGDSVNARGSATVTGDGSQWHNSGRLIVGNAGHADLTVSDGGAVIAANGYLGYNAGVTGTATVTGVDSTWEISEKFLVGVYGSGTLDIENGGQVASGYGSGNDAVLGNFAGADGRVNVHGIGSSWLHSGNMDIGSQGTGRLDIRSGGTVEVAGTTVVGGNGVINLGPNGTLKTHTLDLGGIDGRLNWTGGTLELAGGIADTAVSTIVAGATLAGTGTINGSLDQYGTIAPGNSPGRITVAGNLNSFGNLDLEIAGNAPDLVDSINILGEARLGGTVLVSLDGYAPTRGDHFDVLDFATFDDRGYTLDTSAAELDPGLTWDARRFEQEGILRVTPTGRVALQNATATHSEDSSVDPTFDSTIHRAIDGFFEDTANASGWAIWDGVSPETESQSAAFETQSDIGHRQGTQFHFHLHQLYVRDDYEIGRFRISVTTDDRDAFADGLSSNGDVDADWTVLAPQAVTDLLGNNTFQVLDDESILVSQNGLDQSIYEVTVNTQVTGITGIRLEVIEDPALPTDGPGFATDGNFVLTEFEVFERALNPVASAGSAIDFGAVRIGATTETTSTLVDNTGEAGSVLWTAVSGVDESATASDGFSVVPGVVGDRAVQQGTALQGTFRFKPTQVGAAQDAVQLDYEIGGSDSLSIQGVGVTPSFVSSVAPGGAIDFGTLENDTAASAGLSVQNAAPLTGYAQTLTGLTLLDAVITGGDANLFSLAGFTPGMVLGENALANFDVGFLGTQTPGDYSATLSFTTDQSAAFGETGDLFDFALLASVTAPPQPAEPVFTTGDRLEMVFFLGDLDTKYVNPANPVDNSAVLTVGEGVEESAFPYSEIPYASVDLDEATITMTFLRNLGWMENFGEPIGFSFHDIDGVLDDFVSVEIDPESTLADFNPDSITLSADTIYVDFDGNAPGGEQTLILNVNPIPEPGTALLLAPLSLLMLRRRR